MSHTLPAIKKRPNRGPYAHGKSENLAKWYPRCPFCWEKKSADHTHMGGWECKACFVGGVVRLMDLRVNRRQGILF